MTATTALLRARSLDVPDETISIAGKGRAEVVRLGGVTAERTTFQPGFHWSEHIKPTAGADFCMSRHVGVVLAGQLGVRMADGAERELAAGDAFDIPPGHDVWVIGDQPYVDVSVEFTPSGATPQEVSTVP